MLNEGTAVSGSAHPRAPGPSGTHDMPDTPRRGKAAAAPMRRAM
ncbi:hypothetical protein SGPA1_40742 [Streptomyces misionensis JCM 4497]